MDKATTAIKAAISRCAATIKGASPSWVRGEWSSGSLTITIIYTPASSFPAESGHVGVGLIAITPPEDDRIVIPCTSAQASSWMHSAAWHLGAWDIARDACTFRFRPTWASPLRLAGCRDKTIDTDGTRPYRQQFPIAADITVMGGHERKALQLAPPLGR